MTIRFKREYIQIPAFSTHNNAAFQYATISALNTLKNTPAWENLIDSQMQSADHTVKQNKETVSVCLCITLQKHKNINICHCWRRLQCYSDSFYSHLYKMNINAELSSVITAK